MHFEEDHLIVNNEDLTDMINMPIISNNVSKYAAVPEIREILVKLQQNIAKKYNVIMDGQRYWYCSTYGCYYLNFT